MQTEIEPVKLSLAVVGAWFFLAFFYNAGEAVGTYAYHGGILL